MPNLTGLLAGLGGLSSGILEGEEFQRKQRESQILQQLAQERLRTQQQERLGQSGFAQTLFGGGQPPSLNALLGAGQGGGLTQPPPAPMAPTSGGGGMAAGPPTGPQAGGGIADFLRPEGVRGSWFGNYGNWRDPSDSGLQAGGQPVSAGPGIALRIPKSSPDFGKMYDVTAPSGKTLRLPQTDFGPSSTAPGARDRGVDINARAAEDYGYTPQNFPTDAIFKVAAVNQQIQQSVPPQTRQEAQVGLTNMMRQTPQLASMTGQFDLDGWVKTVNDRNPGASPETKASIFLQGFNLLHPLAKEQYAKQIELLKFETEEKRRGETATETARHHRALEDRPTTAQTGVGSYQILTDPTTGQQYQMRPGAPGSAIDMQGRPYTPGGAERLGGPPRAGAGGKTQSLSLTYPDGRTEEVFAQVQGPGKIVSVVTGQPIDLPPGTQITPLKAPGRQAATQINAMMGSSNEVVRAMSNLVDLPITATSGWFKGVTQHTPEALGEALKRSLANTVTSEDAKAIIISFQGIQRAMATLEAQGRATGLVGLTQQASVLMPQEGDSGMDILRKYAEVRQLTEAALDTLAASPDIGGQQRAKITEMEGKIKETVPWTVKDVNALTRNPSDERVADFATRFGAAGAARGTAAAPSSGGNISTMTIDQLRDLTSPQNRGKLTPEQVQQVQKRAKELMGDQ